MLNRKFVIVLVVLVALLSIFAFSFRRSTGVSEPLYRNLPDGATVTEVTISGTIEEFEFVPGEGATLVILADDGKEYIVRTGPIWLYDGYLKEGAEIEITGRLVSTSSTEYVVAYKMMVDGKEVVVREDGFPSFSGRGASNEPGQMGRSGQVKGGYPRRGR